MKLVHSAVITTACSIPWAFLAMYGDRELGTARLYVLLILSAILLGCVCRRNNCALLLVAGDLLSCLLSCVLANRFWDGNNFYFKPFGVTGWVLALCALVLMIHFLIWNIKKDRSPAMSLLVGVTAVFLLFLLFLIVILGAASLSIV